MIFAAEVCVPAAAERHSEAANTASRPPSDGQIRGGGRHRRHWTTEYQAGEHGTGGWTEIWGKAVNISISRHKICLKNINFERLTKI